MNMKCPFCIENSNGYHSLDLFIEEFEHSYLIMHRNQSFQGRCLLIIKNHYNNFWEIPADVSFGINEELKIVTKSIKDAFDAELINIASLGNQVRHLHYHIIPRYKNDSNKGTPPWPNKELLISQREYNNNIVKIKVEIHKYISNDLLHR